MGTIKKLIQSCDIGSNDDYQIRTEIYKSLKQYVAVMFAVVVAVGLNALDDAKTFVDHFIVLSAYSVIFMSWYGYHLGTIKGGYETNLLNYVIDCLLIVIYWFLLRENNFLIITILYCLIYLLYSLWEVVRYHSSTNTDLHNHIYLKAAWKNFKYIFWFPFLYFFLFLIETSAESLLVISFYHCVFLIFIVLLVILYRRSMGKIYRTTQTKNSAKNLEDKFNLSELIQASETASKNAIVPYSDYRVGAAILSDSGKIYSGCNIEFGNYSNTIHAEESAICSLISAGEKKLLYIAVYTDDNKVQFPCGMCLQSLSELGGHTLKVIAANKTSHRIKTIGELMPEAFSLKEEI